MFTATRDIDARLPSQPTPLATFDPEAAVGELGGDDESEPGPFVFGRLADAELDAEGNLYLLDGDFHTVRVLDRDLSPVQTVGSGPGEGPGEFLQAVSLVEAGPRHLAVLDRRARRVERFRLTPGGYAPDGRTPLPWPLYLRDACITPRGMFLRGVAVTVDGSPVTPANVQDVDRNRVRPGSEFVHRLDESGEARASLSSPYDSIPDVAFAVNLLDGGGLACDEDHLWVAYGILGEVHSFDHEGQLRWISRVSDLEFPGMLYRWSPAGDLLPGSTGLSVDVTEGNYSVESIQRLTLISERVLAVSVHRVTVGDPSDG